MAVIKAINSRASIANAINYITKKEKTDEELISGYNCRGITALDEMKATKKAWNKTGGRQYKHFIQSFFQPKIFLRMRHIRLRQSLLKAGISLKAMKFVTLHIKIKTIFTRT